MVYGRQLCAGQASRDLPRGLCARQDGRPAGNTAPSMRRVLYRMLDGHGIEIVLELAPDIKESWMEKWYSRIIPDLCFIDHSTCPYAHAQRLVREAEEYQDLYHHELKSAPEVREARKAEIRAEIDATGTYSQTFDEAQHGCRVAWRNAPKCVAVVYSHVPCDVLSIIGCACTYP